MVTNYRLSIEHKDSSGNVNISRLDVENGTGQVISFADGTEVQSIVSDDGQITINTNGILKFKQESYNKITIILQKDEYDVNNYTDEQLCKLNELNDMEIGVISSEIKNHSGGSDYFIVYNGHVLRMPDIIFRYYQQAERNRKRIRDLIMLEYDRNFNSWKPTENFIGCAKTETIIIEDPLI